MSALSIGTLIAIVLLALKAGDLLLTAEQQLAVQKYCDNIALRLEYANIGRIYLVFRQKPWQRRIYALPIIAEIAIGIAFFSYADLKRDSRAV